MRKLAAIVVALGLVATGAVTAGAATRQAVRQDDSAVTKDEIKVGVVYVDLAPLRAAGIKRDHGDYQKAWQTVIDDLNAKGGINGRKVVPVYVGVNPLGTDPAQEACVKLTEDEKVFLVMGQFFGTDPTLCYLEQHKMPVLGGTITADTLARAKAPWYTLERSSPDIASIIDAFAADGQFKKKKVGVVASAADQALTESVVLPALKKNKVKPTTVAYATAPPDDLPASRAEMDTILKRMQADGVDVILPVEGSVVSVAGRLPSTDYRPQLLSTSNANVQTYASSQGNDISPLEGLVSGDVSYPYDDPALTKCRDKVAKATGETMQESAVTGEPNNRVSAEIACRYTALLAGLAGAAGKNLTTASLAKAGQKAGTVDIPGSGKLVYDAKTKTFEQPVYLFRFDPAQRLMVRDSEPYTASTK
jgi:ABC-type branched-subunit amino acid transport system substrate-binding protein